MPLSSSSNHPFFQLLHRGYLSLQRFLRPYFPLYQSSTDLKLTLFAILYAILCLFFVCLANAHADYVYFTYLRPNLSVLYDPGMNFFHSLFKQWGIPYSVTDILVGIAMVSTFLLCFSYQKRCSQLVRRVLFITASMYLLRAPTVVMTILPNPNLECKDRRNPNLFIDALLLLVQEHQACGDIFFSGHSIPLTVTARMYFMYAQHWLPKALVAIFCSIGLLSLVMTSMHYSIDVAFSVLLTNFVFSIYHWTVRGKIGRSKAGQLLRKLDGQPDSIDPELPYSRRSSRLRFTSHYSIVLPPTSPRSSLHETASRFTRATVLSNLKDTASAHQTSLLPNNENNKDASVKEEPTPVYIDLDAGGGDGGVDEEDVDERDKKCRSATAQAV